MLLARSCRRPFPGSRGHFCRLSRSLSGDAGRLKVIMDMDECMIHSLFLEGHGSELRQFEERPEVKARLDELSHFKLSMKDGETCLVLQRPFLRDFLQRYKETFDFGVFTAGVEMYASPLLDVLDPDGSVFKLGRWYRSQCTQFGGMYCKDLAQCHDDPKRVLLVDNNAASFMLQPSSGLLVPSWYDDPQDTLFRSGLGTLLEELERSDDVRELLAELQPELQLSLKEVRTRIEADSG